MDGLAPREVTEMYSYDHDLAAFVSIGTGTVSADGALITSDPGVGVIKAGWHCGGNPNPVGSAGTCPTCQKCVGAQCVTDNAQTPPQASPTDCKEQKCSGGAVVNVNKDSEQPTDVCERCSSGAPVDRPDGSTPADANKCCFEGETLDKLGQELGILFDGPLVEKCPQRTQNTARAHDIDGCSGGIPPNIQDPMTNSLYLPFGLLNQAPTAFGLPLGVIPKGERGAGLSEVLDNPRSPMMEAYASLRSAIQFATAQGARFHSRRGVSDTPVEPFPGWTSEEALGGP